MNVKKNDYISLIEQIEIAADKKLSSSQAAEIEKAMENCGWSISYRVTVHITRAINIPKNIYGLILNNLDEEKDRIKKEFNQKESWKISDEDCVTPEEWELTMQCIGLICRFQNAQELCQKFGEYLEGTIARGFLLESLRKAKTFYTDMFKKEVNIKQSQGVF